MIYVFGDSHADANHVKPDFRDFTYYNQVASYFNEDISNFAKMGSGPDYAFKQFLYLCDTVNGIENLNGAKFIFLLSAPERIDFDIVEDQEKLKGLQYELSGTYENTTEQLFIDFFNRHMETEFKISSLKNLMFLHGLSEFIIPEAKFFVNLAFGVDESEFKLNENHLNFINTKNFYYFDIPFNLITIGEYKKLEYTHFDEEYTYRYEHRNKIYMEDDRPNHFSRVNHDKIANIMIEFFDTGKRTKADFDKAFLDENSEFMKRLEWIYE